MSFPTAGSHSVKRKSRHGASAHSEKRQDENESVSAALVPSQDRQQACGSHKGTIPATNPTTCHCDSLSAISKHAARRSLPCTAREHIPSVRGRISVRAYMRSERRRKLGGGGGAGATKPGAPWVPKGGGGGAALAASHTTPSAFLAAQGTSCANMCPDRATSGRVSSRTHLVSPAG